MSARVPVPLLLAALLVAGCGGGPTGSASAPSPSVTAQPGAPAPTLAPATGAWREIASGPLSARAGATAAWAGNRVLVFGGYDKACPAAHCYPQAGDVLADGAAYDPVHDTWTRISPAPAPVLYAQTALAGGILYARTASVDVDATDAARWFAYDIQADTWREIRRGPDGGKPIAAANLLFAQRSSPGEGEAPFAAYDAETDTWNDLPDDELGAGLERSGLGDGGHLYSVAYDFATDEVKARLAAYDVNSRTWTRLPDPPIGALPTVVAGGRLVDPAGPYTAAYDPAAEKWNVGPGHPDEPAAGNEDAFQGYVVGADLVVSSPNQVFDPVAMSWTAIPPHEALGGDGVRFESVADVAAAWAGDRLFVWGGVRRWDESVSEAGEPDPIPAAHLRDTGWVWAP